MCEISLNGVRIVECAPEELPRVSELAGRIWREHFTPIIGSAQVEYMLAKFQSPAAMARQVAEEGFRYFAVADADGLFGYCAVKRETADVVLLSKFYVERTRRGHGCGRRLLEHAIDALGATPGTRVRLFVNRHNAETIAVYRRLGFRIAGECVGDIGNGFATDDFVMEKRLPCWPACKCVIFDVDGTIAESIHLCVAAFQYAINGMLGRQVSGEEVISTFGPSEEGTINAFMPEHFEEGMRLFLGRYAELHAELCPRPFDGMTEIFAMLKERNVRLGIVTGKGMKSLDITLAQFGLHGVFDAIEAGSPKGPDKPGGLRRVLDTLRFEPYEAVYIGDSPGDIMASREVGIPAIAAAWSKSADVQKLAATHPERLLRTVAELRQRLAEMV